MLVWFLTHGTGADGDEWGVSGVYSTKEKAQLAKARYEKPRYRPDGSTYTFEAEVEAWTVDEDNF